MVLGSLEGEKTHSFVGFLCLLSALLQQQFFTLAVEPGLKLIPNTPGTSLILAPQKYLWQLAGPLLRDLRVPHLRDQHQLTTALSQGAGSSP